MGLDPGLRTGVKVAALDGTGQLVEKATAGDPDADALVRRIWALLASIWFGVSNFTVIFVQTAILIPFCLVNISEGVRLLDRDLLEMGKSFTGRSRRIFTRITVPLLLPYIVSALRSAYGVAWKIALVAELFGAQSGLGFAMLRAENVANTTGVLAICLMIVIVGIAGDRFIIQPLDRRTQGISSIG